MKSTTKFLGLFVVILFATTLTTVASDLNEQPKKVLLSPFLESFESMGTGKHSVSSKGRDLSNWASFGYYTGWLLHCDWSEKRRMEELLEDTESC